MPTRSLAAAMAATAAIAALAQALPASAVGAMNSEDGVFETLSAVVLGSAAAVGLWQAVRSFSLARVAAALCVVGLFLRELDFQKRFTYRSIESFGFYTRPIASWSEKILGAAALITLALAAAWVGRAAWRNLPGAIARGDAWLRTVGAAAPLVGSSLVAEKFLHFVVAEEVFETGFAFMVLTLVWQLRATTHEAAPEAPAAVPAAGPAVVFPQAAAHAQRDLGRKAA